jgi:hypothetical protein
MRNCLKCGNQVPNLLVVDGKKRNLKNRKYCIECSPFGKHNTRKIHDDNLINSPINQCRICEKEYSGGHGKYKSICTSCRVSESRRKKKADLIEYKGNKCCVCGYDKCIQALQFHHLDPNKKEFTIANSGTMKFEVLKHEADKCILVCSNCHVEIHFGLIDIHKYL